MNYNGLKPTFKGGISATQADGGAKMVKEVRARYSKGKLELLEKLDLEEGEEIVISIKKQKSKFADSDWKQSIEKGANQAGFTKEEQVNELIYEQRRRNG